MQILFRKYNERENKITQPWVKAIYSALCSSSATSAVHSDLSRIILSAIWSIVFTGFFFLPFVRSLFSVFLCVHLLHGYANAV